LTVKRGGKITDVLTFPAQGNFSAAIALTCNVAGTAPLPTCGISPAAVNPGSSATLTLDASNLSAALAPKPVSGLVRFYALSLPIGVLGLLLSIAAPRKHRRNWLLASVVLLIAFLPAACGGGGNSTPPPPKNFTVTVDATSGTFHHSTTINLTVN